MAKKERIKRKARSRKGYSIGKVTLLGILIVFGLLVVNALTQVLGARPGGGGSGGYDVLGGCAKTTSRPCFDKLTSSGVNLLGKNGTNTYTSCTTNAAPNKVGEIIHKTSFCGQEKVMYCHDGKSNNFIRKFAGECSTEPPPPPPPPPPPTPEPTPTPGPVSGTPFKMIYPNGGEQLLYGSNQVVRWEGGDTVNSWPIYLSIGDKDNNVVIREMVADTPNDGQEDWVVDLPLGDYYIFAGQGCRFSTCISATEWDYTDNKFSVVAGAPVEKINSSNPLNQSLVVLSPSGGEGWLSGSSQTIKWSGKTATATINLAVSDGNSTVSIASDTVNDGTQDWVVPGFIPPGQYKVSVQCTNCEDLIPGFTDGNWNYSFRSFSIQ